MLLAQDGVARVVLSGPELAHAARAQRGRVEGRGLLAREGQREARRPQPPLFAQGEVLLDRVGQEEQIPVGEEEPVPAGRADGVVAAGRGAEALVGLRHDLARQRAGLDVRPGRREGSGPRAVVGHDHLVGQPRLRLERGQAAGEELGPLVSGHDRADPH